MPIIIIIATAVAVVGLCLFLLRRQPIVVTYTDEREERLTRRLASQLHSSLADALPSVREELRIAPDQPDETILKRAAYHYRLNVPEKACSVYRDSAKG